MPREKMLPPQPPTNETPWERFERITKRVIAAPKDAVVKPLRKQSKRKRT